MSEDTQAPIRRPMFNEPTSIGDADLRRQALIGEIQTIQAQLGDRHRTDKQGRRLPSHEYWDWSRKARYSLNLRLEELRSIKDWIKSRRPPDIQGNISELHLKNLYLIAREAMDDGVEFNELEQQTIISAGEFLLQNGVGVGVGVADATRQDEE